MIWLEAERFDDRGGWVNDCQFVELMGSPYLLAAGLGKPVPDAVTRFRVREAGRYQLWVRCKDWYPSHAPGRFRVLVGGQCSSVTFGQDQGPNWGWVAGGWFDLLAGELELRLRDLTGWWGRCDAVVLSQAPAFRPSDHPETLAAQRERYGGISREISRHGPYDVVVAGGGLAGTAAAVAAARGGCRVVLLQDRPVLGGNGSTEIQVPVQGDLTYEPWDPRETGLIEECDPRTVGSGTWSNNLEKLVRGEPNIDLFLNLRLSGVVMAERGRIEAVRALHTRTGERSEFSGRLFIDCTGDAWLGYWAGADYRHGREARDEFDEAIAPDKPDGHTQCSSLNAGKLKTHDQPVSFEAPAWAYRWETRDSFEPHSMGAVWNDGRRVASFDDLTKGRGRRPQAARCPVQEWYVEWGGAENTIADAERIRDELFRINIGLWDFVKNRDPEYRLINQCRELVWLNHVVGKRESRRLMGDYVLSQRDMQANTSHPDTVAYAGWAMDVHHPCGFFTAGPQAHLEYMNRTTIPYRCLYSRNIGNLMMAGRIISVTHLALGKTRVMRICFLTGWAAGAGAAIAVRERVSPRVVGEKHVEELQQTLLREGGYIPGLTNRDETDLARHARVSASSSAIVRHPRFLVTLPQYYWIAKHPLDTGLATQFRAPADRIESISLFLRSMRPEPVRLKLTLRASRWAGDLAVSEDLASAEAEVPAHHTGWLEFPLRATTTQGNWYYVFLPRAPGLVWDLYKYHPPETRRGYETPPGWSCEWGCHKFRLTPGGEPPASRYIAEHGLEIPFPPENAINGISRVVDGDPNAWAPATDEPLPQWLELTWPQPVRFNEIRLAFQMAMLAPKAYSVQVPDNESEWRTVFRETDNRRRRRTHRFEAVQTNRLRLTIEERNPHAKVPLTPVCEIRVCLSRPSEASRSHS